MTLSKTSSDNIIKYLTSLKNEWEIAKASVETTWHDAWARFIGTPEAHKWLLRSADNHYIDSSNENSDVMCDDAPSELEWRHHVPTGKGFEITETLWSYLMQATFSNEQWLAVSIEEQEHAEEAHLLTKVMQAELRRAEFSNVYSNWLRQLTVVGNSAMRVGWCNEECQLDFNYINMYRVLIEPTASPSEADVMVLTNTTRRALKRKIGEYNMLTNELLMQLTTNVNPAIESNSDVDRSFVGVNTTVTAGDKLAVYEYYGSIYDDMEYLGDDCYVVFCGEDILHFETGVENPIVVGSFIEVPDCAWGVSPVTASNGLMTADEVFMNSRLDNLYTTTMDVHTYRQDSVVDPNFTIYPGALIPVLEHDAIQPLQRSGSNLPLTYREEQSLENRINRNTGLIPGVGSGQTRQAERVTAREIIASQQVGGTRLNQYHTHIERNMLNRMLQIAYQMLQKYGVAARTLKMEHNGNSYSIGYTPKECCCKEVEFNLRGAEAVLGNNSELDRTVEFADFAGKVLQQQVAAAQAGQAGVHSTVDWGYILKRVAYLWGIAEPERIMQNTANSQTEVAPPQTQSEPTPIVPTASQQAAIDANVAVDGGASSLNRAYNDVRLK